jgi:hypothetical protein
MRGAGGPRTTYMDTYQAIGSLPRRPSHVHHKRDGWGLCSSSKANLILKKKQYNEIYYAREEARATRVVVLVQDATGAEVNLVRVAQV